MTFDSEASPDFAHSLRNWDIFKTEIQWDRVDTLWHTWPTSAAKKKIFAILNYIILYFVRCVRWGRDPIPLYIYAPAEKLFICRRWIKTMGELICSQECRTRDSNDNEPVEYKILHLGQWIMVKICSCWLHTKHTRFQQKAWQGFHPKPFTCLNPFLKMILVFSEINFSILVGLYFLMKIKSKNIWQMGFEPLKMLKFINTKFHCTINWKFLILCWSMNLLSKNCVPGYAKSSDLWVRWLN